MNNREQGTKGLRDQGLRDQGLRDWVPQVRGPRGQVFVRGVEVSLLRPGRPQKLISLLAQPNSVVEVEY
jgi:hypothetical protein